MVLNKGVKNGKVRREPIKAYNIYVAGWRTLWPSHYTEDEVKAEIAKAKTA
jgi:hypothetical protein